MFSTAFSILVLGAATLARGVHLESRAAQSQAVCSTQFAWMDNSKSVSPCQVVASVDALCNEGNWIIPALNSSFHYDNPVPGTATAGATATRCTCSWASYNLLSACIACQGFPQETPQWTVYSNGCAGELTNTFFPTNLTLGADVAIPFWAQTDPTKWPGETFSATQAQQFAAEGHPDFVGGTAPAPKKSKNTGAIVGGVIGSLVVVAAAAAIAFYMIRRQRRASRSASSAPGSYPPGHPGHIRNMSDMSTSSNLKSMGGYTSFSSAALQSDPPTSPTLMTHNSSIRSVPYFSSVVPSTAPYGTASPPPVPTRQMTSTPPNPENHVEPYILPPTVDNPDRKQSNGAYGARYDSPNAPPPNPPPSAIRMESVRPHAPSARARINPPMYEESSPGNSSPAPGQRPPHRSQPSNDSQHSLTSSRTGGGRPDLHHSPNSSGSNMANMVGQMGGANPVNPDPRGEPRPSGYGRQVSASRDEKRRQGSFSASEIA